MRCKLCDMVIVELPQYCQECDRSLMREVVADTAAMKTEAYEQAIKDAMAKLAEIKDLPADRCREELRRFVATHNDMRT